jgi:ubiquinone biosynthesis protein UbiJ
MLTEITSTLLAFAEIGGNKLLAMDSQVLERCSELQGRCVEIQVTDLDLKLYCHPGNWGIRLSLDEPVKTIDATISGRLIALVNLATEEDKVATSIQEGVSINGNAAVAKQMQKIFTELELDWEEALSHYTGDVLAYRIHKQARSTRDWLQQSIESLSHTSSEYLREEVRLTPTQVEFERFQQQVTTLKQDVERTEARLRHLLQLLSTKTSNKS